MNLAERPEERRGVFAGWTRLKHFLCLGAAIFSAPLIHETAAQASHEYHLKAAFLYNFLSFVIWPSEAFDSNEDPFVMTVIGQNPFDGILREMLSNEWAGPHPCVYLETDAITDAATSHILFISRSERYRVRRILKAVEGLPILTVSDIPGFAEMGGMIEFRNEYQFVRLTINRERAIEAGLEINSRLLRLARVMGEELPTP